MSKDIIDNMLERIQEIDAEINDLREEKDRLKEAIAILKKPAGSLDYAGEPTFKEKVRTALFNDFPDGATALQLLDYLNSRWKRPVKRSSLSPQLSRLKDENIIDLIGNRWKLKNSVENVAKGFERLANDLA